MYEFWFVVAFFFCFFFCCFSTSFFFLVHYLFLLLCVYVFCRWSVWFSGNLYRHRVNSHLLHTDTHTRFFTALQNTVWCASKKESGIWKTKNSKKNSQCLMKKKNNTRMNTLTHNDAQNDKNLVLCARTLCLFVCLFDCLCVSVFRPGLVNLQYFFICATAESIYEKFYFCFLTLNKTFHLTLWCANEIKYTQNSWKKRKYGSHTPKKIKHTRDEMIIIF